MRLIHLLLAGLLCAGAVHAEDAEPAGTEAADPAGSVPGLLLEPGFAGHEMHYPIAGARQTLLVAARPAASGVKVINRRMWEEDGLSWEVILPPALERAEKLAGEVEIEWIRDGRGVILYGMIESPEPMISGILFTQGLLERVRENLGDTVHAVVPNRASIFLFPGYGSRMKDYAASLRAMYRESPLKVSLEILELSQSGVRAAGVIADPE